VLLPLQVREDAGLLHLPLEAAKHSLEIVTFVDDNLYHYFPLHLLRAAACRRSGLHLQRG
jgi:hypothetical protein